MNDKHQLFYASKKLRETLKVIENLLENYDGIDGNKNYVKYCWKKAKEANKNDITLNQLYDDTYNVDLKKRKGINIAVLLHIIERHFKLLDDIDSAGDMFKPKWCKFTSAVQELQMLRWLSCYIEGDNKDENSLMKVNGACYKKEERIVLNF